MSAHVSFEACRAFAVITLDKRGTIRQEAAPNLESAEKIARKRHATLFGLLVSVAIEGPEGHVVYSREYR